MVLGGHAFRNQPIADFQRKGNIQEAILVNVTYLSLTQVKRHVSEAMGRDLYAFP